jgi:hypothetical protein
MSDTVVISWNFTNWITVILMALIAWAIYRMVTGFVQNRVAE